MKIYRDLNSLPKFKNAIVTIGTFDGVHFGHRQILKRINNLAQKHDGESVLVTFDPHPRLIVNPTDDSLRLITTLEEKLTLLESCELQNVVVVPFDRGFSMLSAEEYVNDFLVKYFNPQKLVIGYDHRFGKGRTGNIDLLHKLSAKHNFQVEEITKQEVTEIVVSSTKVRKALEAGAVKDANALLGNPYSLSGTVVRGTRIGRQIGFPTANVQTESKHKLLPKIGVYAVLVEVNNQTFKGMMNIGFKPTFHGNTKTIEVNLFDFNGDLYNQDVKVTPVDRIRDEEKFESIDAIKAQLVKDKVAALNMLG